MNQHKKIKLGVACGVRRKGLEELFHHSQSPTHHVQGHMVRHDKWITVLFCRRRSGIVNQSQNQSVHRLATINQSDSTSKKKTHWVRTNLLRSMQNNASRPCYILLSIFPGCLVWDDHCKNCHQPSRCSHPACCIWHSRCLTCGTPSHTGHYIHSGWQCATYAQWGETNIPIKYVCPIYIQLVEEWSSFFFFNSNTTKPKATVSYWNPI